METYAVERLMRIFKQYKNEIKADDCKILSETIIYALIEETQTYDRFKLKFSKNTLDRLFNGYWKCVNDFINATDDELDLECAKFRQDVRLKEFNRMENTKRINEFLDQDAEKSENGLICSRCKSNNTDYHLMQTKSGDESSTIFALCKNCGKRWKFSA